MTTEKNIRALIALVCFAGAAMAAEFPEAEISNGLIRAKLRLPDPQHGYYQGTRFDWSGVIASLQYEGHEYFGQWFEKYDPKIHDAITGPVEEFLSEDAGLGYAEAKTGGTFIRIGVGVVRKPDAGPFRRFDTYEIVDHGKWNVRKAGDHVEFTQAVRDDAGYAYLYRKTVRLVKGKPEMVLEHSLKNTGKRAIDTAVYDHNFFVIDGTPSGPEFTVKFPFAVESIRDMKDLAAVKTQDLVYRRDLQKGESIMTELKGYGSGASDYDFRIENHKAGAGVRIQGDQPLEKVLFWSIRTTLCPEPYIHLRVEPGQEATWRIRYEFYTF